MATCWRKRLKALVAGSRRGEERVWPCTPFCVPVTGSRRCSPPDVKRGGCARRTTGSDRGRSAGRVMQGILFLAKAAEGFQNPAIAICGR
ncbi:hypothetical protein LNP74_20360 [Klebsiella pneumoniae subsp. pneumoniae]|nr:hypothetical protein [Klebsiella pneumoniae subsp. pneumoniae]